VVKEEVKIEENSIFAFPKGARPGTFLHEIFEHLDFTETNQEVVETLINEKLTAYAYDEKWMQALVTMVKNVLNTPLEPGRVDFTLSSIDQASRLNEFPRYIKLKQKNFQFIL